MKISRLLSLLACLCFCSSLHARVGDTAKTLEDRISADQLAAEIKGESGAALVSKGPLRRFLDFTEELEQSFAYKVYMKSADGTRISSQDAREMNLGNGWIYTAMFLQGVVVAETYERKNGKGEARLNPHEKKGLLAVNQSVFAWEELDDMVLPSGEEVEGMTEYHYLRNDSKVFARFDRNYAIFIRKELDEKLRERRSIRNAEVDQQNRGALQLSIAGF